MWNEVGPALRVVEDTLGLSYETAGSTPKPPSTAHTLPPSASVSTEPGVQAFTSFEDEFESSMAVHALIMGVVFHTHAGKASDATLRLTHLHTLLDSGATKRIPHGIVQVSFVSTYISHEE